jgi:hypothetical protein
MSQIAIESPVNIASTEEKEESIVLAAQEDAPKNNKHANEEEEADVPASSEKKQKMSEPEEEKEEDKQPSADVIALCEGGVGATVTLPAPVAPAVAAAQIDEDEMITDPVIAGHVIVDEIKMGMFARHGIDEINKQCSLEAQKTWAEDTFYNPANRATFLASMTGEHVLREETEQTRCSMRVAAPKWNVLAIHKGDECIAYMHLFATNNAPITFSMVSWDKEQSE